jgi:hypothetical protein
MALAVLSKEFSETALLAGIFRYSAFTDQYPIVFPGNHVFRVSP